MLDSGFPALYPGVYLQGYPGKYCGYSLIFLSFRVLHTKRSTVHEYVKSTRARFSVSAPSMPSPHKSYLDGQMLSASPNYRGSHRKGGDGHLHIPEQVLACQELLYSDCGHSGICR